MTAPFLSEFFNFQKSVSAPGHFNDGPRQNLAAEYIRDFALPEVQSGEIEFRQNLFPEISDHEKRLSIGTHNLCGPDAGGNAGDQLVYLPSDLKRFKKLTSGHAVVFGSKTLQTFPNGRPLPNRDNYLLTKKTSYMDGVTVCHSIDQLLTVAPHNAFVVGGGEIYRQLEPYCDTAYITKMLISYQADTWFPNLDNHPGWFVFDESNWHEENGIPFRYITYKRRIE